MRTIQVALVGTGFMAKTHSLALSAYQMMQWPPVALPVRNTIVSHSADRASQSAQRFGFARWTCNINEVLADKEIELIIIATPNDTHMQYALAALEAGKHVICEKPLACSLYEAGELTKAYAASSCATMVAFNYRRLPAVVFARQLLDEGRLGSVQSLHIEYMQDTGADSGAAFTWRHSREKSGSGALGDIGSHIMDMACYLAGNVVRVNGSARTLYNRRVMPSESNAWRTVDVDDEFNILLCFSSGAQGTMKASRNAWGRNNQIRFEVNCEKGAIRFDMEHNGELEVYFSDQPQCLRGFTRIATGEAHPNSKFFWPLPGMGIGYSEPLMVQLDEMLRAIVQGGRVHPDFEDGYQIAKICEAVERSGESGHWETV